MSVDTDIKISYNNKHVLLWLYLISKKINNKKGRLQ